VLPPPDVFFGPEPSAQHPGFKSSSLEPAYIYFDQFLAIKLRWQARIPKSCVSGLDPAEILQKQPVLAATHAAGPQVASCNDNTPHRMISNQKWTMKKRPSGGFLKASETRQLKNGSYLRK
jgi:hypothetical protein